jgi:stage II sporulation SpoM-like protein
MQSGRTRTAIGEITSDAARCATAAGGAIVLTAVAVTLSGLRDDTRAGLRFGFDGVDPSLAEAASIALHNATIAGGVLLCGVLAPHLTPRARCSIGLVVAVVLGLNAAAIGLALGAYGTRALRALAPHAPLELAALSLPSGAYLHACKQRPTLPALVVVACTSAILLVVGAALETYAGATR